MNLKMNRGYPFFIKQVLSLCAFVFLLYFPLGLLAQTQSTPLHSVLKEILGWNAEKIKAFTVLFEKTEAKPYFDALVQQRQPQTQNDYLYILNEALQKFWFREAKENSIQKRFASITGKPIKYIKERYQIANIDLAALEPAKLTLAQQEDYQSLLLIKRNLIQFGIFNSALYQHSQKTGILILAHLGATFSSAESRAQWGAKLLKQHPELNPKFILLASGNRSLNSESDLTPMQEAGYAIKGITSEFEMMKAIEQKHFAGYKGNLIEVNVPLHADGRRPNTTDTFEYAGREIKRLIQAGKINSGQKINILILSEAPNFFVQTQQAKTGLIKANAPMHNITLEYTGAGIPEEEQTHSETLVLGLSAIAGEVYTVEQRQRNLLAGKGVRSKQATSGKPLVACLDLTAN